MTDIPKIITCAYEHHSAMKLVQSRSFVCSNKVLSGNRDQIYPGRPRASHLNGWGRPGFCGWPELTRGGPTVWPPLIKPLSVSKSQALLLLKHPQHHSLYTSPLTLFSSIAFTMSAVEGDVNQAKKSFMGMPVSSDFFTCVSSGTIAQAWCILVSLNATTAQWQYQCLQKLQ